MRNVPDGELPLPELWRWHRGMNDALAGLSPRQRDQQYMQGYARGLAVRGGGR